MTTKRKFLTLISMCLFTALLLLALSACSGSVGPQGPQGITGEQGIPGANGATWLFGEGAPADGNGADGDLYLDTTTYDIYIKAAGAWTTSGNIQGDDAADTFAVVIFDADSEDIVCNPVFVEKGEKATLPTPEKFGYEFSGWYYYGGEYPVKVTDQTVIEDNMALKARWTPQITLESMDTAYVAEPWYASLYYPLMDDYPSAIPLAIDFVEYKGKKYTEDEALEAGIILEGVYIDADDKYDYTTDTYMDTGYYTVSAAFGVTGEISLNLYNPFGSKITLDVTVQAPVFNGAMMVESIGFNSGTGTDIYAPGTTVAYLKGTVPAIDMTVTFRAPYGSTFSATLNGEALTLSGSEQSGEDYYNVTFIGTLDETQSTHVFTFTVTSETYGTKTETFIVNEIETPVENMILYHDYLSVVAPDEGEFDTYYEILTYYSVDGVTPVVSTVLTDSEGNVLETISPTVSVDGNFVSYNFQRNFYVTDVPSGMYTMTTTIKSDSTEEATDILPPQITTFYIAPCWVEQKEHFMILNNPIDMIYELDAAITSLEINGQKIVAGEKAYVTSEIADFVLSFAVVDGQTILTVTATSKEMTQFPPKDMLYTTVSTDEYTWELTIYGVETMEEGLIRTYAQVEYGSTLYALETYLSTWLTVDGPVKDFYEAINMDFANEDIAKVCNLIMGNDEIRTLYEAAKNALNQEMAEGETIEPILTQVREKALSETYFSEQNLMWFDNSFAGFELFRDIWGNNYRDLLSIGQAEFVYTYQHSRLLADMFYYEVFDMMLEDLEDMPEVVANIIRGAIEAHRNLVNAEAAGVTETDELLREYMLAMEDFLFIVVGTGGPMIII